MVYHLDPVELIFLSSAAREQTLRCAQEEGSAKRAIPGLTWKESPLAARQGRHLLAWRQAPILRQQAEHCGQRVVTFAGHGERATTP